MQNDDSNNSSSGAEAAGADRRSFMRTAVKTVVAGAAVAGGVAAMTGSASAAPQIPGACGAVTVPKAVVKARVVCNNIKRIRRDDLITLLTSIFDASSCPACGLGGFPGPLEDYTIAAISLETGFLPEGQPAAVIFQAFEQG
jgi:hypothetical protein